MAELTPMMQQYQRIKEENGDALQFDGARKRYLRTEEFERDKPNGYGRFKVFWLRRRLARRT